MRGHEMQSAELQALQRAANLPAAAADARREKLRGGQRRRGSAHGSRPGLLLLVRRPSQAVLREFQGPRVSRSENISRLCAINLANLFAVGSAFFRMSHCA